MTDHDDDGLERMVSRVLHERYPVTSGPARRSVQRHRTRTSRTALAVGSGLGIAAAVVAIAVAVQGSTSETSRRDPHIGSAGAAPAATSSSTGRHAEPAGRVLDRTYRLFVHCGVPVIEVGGRAWAPVPPVPTYPGNAPSNGVTTDDGFAAGILRQLDDSRLRFDATNSAASFSVLFAPAAPSSPSTSRVCA